MSNNILFVFEGESTEKKITDSLTKYFVNENTVVQCAFCTDIYQLHKEISEDEDLDTFVLLKEKPQNTGALSTYVRNDFAEIYLFFDYDGHATNASDDKIKEVLSFFDEETSAGKLFLSYPMVEALKHYNDNLDFKILAVKAKVNIGYKKIVHQESKEVLKGFAGYTREIWEFLLELHLKKLNYIVRNSYTIPTERVSQYRIFQDQIEKYINTSSTVAVLSSFPVFLFEYYGYAHIKGMISKD